MHSNWLSKKLPQKSDLSLFKYIIVLLYLALAGWASIYYFPFITIDYEAYLNIARKYSEGNFKDALNAYWSPLISWILVPFFCIGANPHLSFKVINILLGAGILLLLFRFSEKFKISTITQIIFYPTVAVFLIYFAIETTTPDFLMVFCWLLYLYYFISENKNPYLLGILAALAFFCKNYFLPFYFAHFILIIIYQLFIDKTNWKANFLFFTKTSIVLIFILGIWASFLSLKYEKFTLNSSSRYNSWYISPDGYKPHFAYETSLVAPFDSNAIFAWEDPTYYPVIARNPFMSKEEFNYQIGVWKYNWEILKYMFRYFSYFSFGILIFALLAFWKFKKDNNYFAINSAIWIYIMGYFLIFIEERYIWPAYFLLLFLVFAITDYLLKTYLNNKNILQITILVIISLAFLKSPYMLYSYTKNYVERNKYLFTFCEKIASEFDFNQKRIASNNHYDKIGLLAFEQKSFYYGEFQKNSPDSTHLAILKQFDIDYYFHFYCDINNDNECNNVSIPSYLDNLILLKEDDILKVRIYKLKE